MDPPTSAIPDFYYFFFAVYEPALVIISSIYALYNPTATHNAQASWPANSPPPAVLPKASIVTVIQLADTGCIIGLLNISVLTAARKYLALQPALQAKMVQAFLTPLLIGDVSYIYVTLWGLEWDGIAKWTLLTWVTVVSVFILMIPRIMWHLGIWRYVDARDRAPARTESSQPGSESKKG